MKCSRCGRIFKPWTVRNVTVEGMGPTCARILRMVPTGRRKLKPRRVRKDEAQIELELTA